MQAFDEEELDDSSSENETGQIGPAEAGFNFSVPAESFLPADQIREDSPVLSPNSGEKMIISVELSNKETLEVYSPKPPSTGDDEGGGGGGVEDGVPNDEPSHVMAESTEKNHIHSLTVTAVPENTTKVQSLATTNEQNILQETQSPAISTNLTSEVNNEMVCDSLTPAEAISVSLPVASKTEDQRDGEEEEEDDDVKEDKTKDEVMNEPSVDRPAIEDDDGGSVATQEEVSEESVDIVSDVNPEPGEDDICRDGAWGRCQNICRDGAWGRCQNICRDGAWGRCQTICRDGAWGRCQNICRDGCWPNDSVLPAIITNRQRQRFGQDTS